MDLKKMYDSESIKSVFFPTDFSESGNAALFHALHFAGILNIPLTIFHVGTKTEQESRQIIIDYLTKLGLISQDDDPGMALIRLNIRLETTPRDEEGRLHTIISHLKEAPGSLLILPTEGRDGLQRWLHPSMAEKIAEETRLPAVFIPEKANRILNENDHKVQYTNILLPIDHKPDPRISIQFADWLADGSDEIKKLILFHAGEINEIPQVELPRAEHYIWHKIHESGDPVDKIIDVAEEYKANIIIMSTVGKQGFLDAFSGSVTEQVIRNASCPVIAVPAIMNEEE